MIQLPPIIDIITSQSKWERQILRTIKSTRRPQTRGMIEKGKVTLRVNNTDIEYIRYETILP